MKCILCLVAVLAVCFLSAVPANAQFKQGDFDLTLSGSGSSNHDLSGTTFGVTISPAYFVTNNVEVGLRQSVGYGTINGSSEVGGSTFGFVDFNINSLGRLVPFAGVNVGASYGQLTEPNFSAGPEAGLKLFVNDATYIYGMASYQLNFQGTNQSGFLYSVGVGFRF